MSRRTGFTLVEMAVVLAIVGLLLAGLLPPLSAQLEQQRRTETRKALEAITDALVGHALRTGRLPRPAQSAANGLEKTTECIAAADCQGFLPWATLGVARADAWGNLYRYGVAPGFAAAIPFSLSTPANITIKAAPGTNLSRTDDVPAAVVSHGANGHGAVSESGWARPAVPGGNPDEIENAANTTGPGVVVYAHEPTAAGSARGEFDDLVAWVSPNALFHRMVSAGRLP